MTAVRYLEQIKQMNEDIKNDMDELAFLQDLSMKTTASFNGSRVISSNSNQKMADCVIKITELKKRINDEVGKYVDFRNYSLNFIHDVCDADSARLLYLRYFCFETWENIADKMHYSYQWIHKRLHKKALEQLQAGLNEKYK